MFLNSNTNFSYLRVNDDQEGDFVKQYYLEPRLVRFSCHYRRNLQLILNLNSKIYSFSLVNSRKFHDDRKVPY